MTGREGSKPEWDLTGMLISCDDCRMQGTDACQDCVVTYLLDRPDGAVVFDAEEERAIRALNKAGLLPEVRWEQAAGG